MINLPSAKYFLSTILLLSCVFALSPQLHAAPEPGKAADTDVTSDIEEEPGSGIFKQVDKDGRVIFTDNPNRERADTEVELKDMNMHSGELATPKMPQRPPAKAQEKQAVYRIWLKSPKNNAQIGPAKKVLEVTIGVNQSLPRYIRTQLYWDGSPYGEPQIGHSASIPVDGLMSRGRRSLRAELVNIRTGEVLARSKQVNIHVIRP